MTDTDQTIQQTAAKAHEPEPHAYDAPGLTLKEFLLAVMRDTTLPLSTRINAAAAALPYFTPRPGESRHYESVPYHIKYIIGGIPPEALEGKNRNQQSFLSNRPSNSGPQSENPHPLNIEKGIEGPIPDHLTLCTRCGEFVFYPCAKAPLN